MELHERIALARKQAGLSQEQLGEKLGVSRQAISKWESGQTNPDISYVTEMCRLFGVSSDWLLLGESSDPTAAPSRCPNCSAIVTGLDHYCPNCGQNLSAPPEATYAMLLQDGEYIARAKDIVDQLSKTDLFPADSVLARPLEDAAPLIDHIPCILARGLTRTQVQAIREKIYNIDCYGQHFFFFYPDSAGSTPEELASPKPLPLNPLSLKEEKSPLSFGMVVLAVILGIVIASFL